MNKPLFSVTLIAKNEAKSLPNLLASLTEFKKRGGEVFLVDTGSTDDTVKIAREWGCRVTEVGGVFVHTIDEGKAAEINEKFIVGGERPIVEAGDSYFDFGKARQFVTDLIDTDFAWRLDSDEVVIKFDIDKVNTLLVEGWTQLRVDYIWSQNKDGSPAVRFYRDGVLFDRRIWKWAGSIHETTIAPPEAKWMNLPTDIGLIEHHQVPTARKNRDLVGLAISCLNEPGNDRHAHYFARELMFKGRYRSAVQQFLRHAKMEKWDLERGQSMTFIGDCYRYLGDIGKALEWYNTSFMFCSARREPLMRMAEIFYQKKDHQRAACYASAALAIPYLPFYANKLEHYRDLPHAILYFSLWWLGDKEGAKEHWKKALSYSPTNEKYLDEGKFFGAGTDSQAVTKVIPDAFSYETVLYIGANSQRQVLAQQFKDGGASIDLLEIWAPNLKALEKTHAGIFDNFILGDASCVDGVLNKTYDVVCWWHGPEHIAAAEFKATLKALEKFAKHLVIAGCPFGNYPQGAIDGNPHEVHLQALTPEDFQNIGWEAVASGEKDDLSAFIIAWKRKG